MSALWKDIKQNLANSNNWLFIICFLFTIVYIGMSLTHFFSNGKYKLNIEFSGIYLPLVFAYATKKEIGRWLGDKITIQRPGELMVYLLWTTELLMYSINFIARQKYSIPGDLKSVCIWVTAIFIASTISKTKHQKESSRNTPTF